MYAAPWRRVADRVPEQIDEHLTDAVGVSEIHDPIFGFGDRDLYRTRDRLRCDECHGVAHLAARQAGMPSDLEMSGLALRHVEEVVRDADQMLHGALRSLEEVRLLLGELRPEVALEQL